MSRFLFIPFILIFLFSGCSNTESPVLPEGFSCENVPEIAGVNDSAYLRGELSLGIWEVSVDLDTLETDHHMVRSAGAIGQTIPDALLSTYLTVTPCSTCMRMDTLTYHPNTGRISLDIGVRHPMEVFNGSEPITAANRADLDVFNFQLHDRRHHSCGDRSVYNGESGRVHIIATRCRHRSDIHESGIPRSNLHAESFQGIFHKQREKVRTR